MSDRQNGKMKRTSWRLAETALAAATILATFASDQDAPTIRILISQSPWLNSFVSLVDEYQTDTQVAYTEAGGIPIRKDLGDTSLADDPQYRFIKAFSENADVAKMNTPLKEGVRLKEVISLYLNRALIGEISRKDALNGAAKDANQVLTEAGYKLTPPKML